MKIFAGVMDSKFATVFEADSMANFESETTLESKIYLVSSSNPKFENAHPVMKLASA